MLASIYGFWYAIILQCLGIAVITDLLSLVMTIITIIIGIKYTIYLIDHIIDKIKE